jgi:hypothetical protein
MSDEPKKRRKPQRKRAAEVVDFTDYSEVHAWITERARANMRTVSQELVYRLAASKRSIDAGSRNLKGSTGD